MSALVMASFQGRPYAVVGTGGGEVRHIRSQFGLGLGLGLGEIRHTRKPFLSRTPLLTPPPASQVLLVPLCREPQAVTSWQAPALIESSHPTNKPKPNPNPITNWTSHDRPLV